MFGLRTLRKKRVLDVFLILSIIMMVYATALAPADDAPTTLFVLWIAGALLLLASWILSAVELAKRYLGKDSFPGRDPDD